MTDTPTPAPDVQPRPVSGTAARAATTTDILAAQDAGYRSFRHGDGPDACPWREHEGTVEAELTRAWLAGRAAARTDRVTGSLRSSGSGDES